MYKYLGNYKIDFDTLPPTVQKSIKAEQKKLPSAYNDVLQY